MTNSTDEQSDRHLAQVIDEMREASNDVDPAELTAVLLQRMATEDTPAWCHVPAGLAEQLIHHDPEFTIYVLAGTVGVRFPPHEHTLAVSTLVLSGEETNIWFRELDDETIEQTGRSVSAKGAVGYMAEDVIHAVEYPSAQPQLALHIYHGDLFNVDRRMWNPDGSSPRPFDQNSYDRLTIDI